VRIPVKRSLARSFTSIGTQSREVSLPHCRPWRLERRSHQRANRKLLTSFDGFGLNDAITRAIAEQEKHAPLTPIQAPTVPVVMSRAAQ
jgi:hypothetical protein